LHGVASIVRGRVVTTTGRGVAFARISFPDEPRRVTWSDAQGEYWLIYLTRGSHRIRVDAPGYSTGETVIEAPASFVLPIELDAREHYRVLPLMVYGCPVAWFPYPLAPLDPRTGAPVTHVYGDADPIRNGGWLVIPLTEKPGPDSR
jgi:hypothetical protein